MSRFVETLSAGIGPDTYHGILSNSGLSRDWRSPGFFLSMDSSQAAEAYARLQSAMRTYYGRGARGILLRIGSKLWEPLLKDASIAAKAQSALVRGLPKVSRRKPALDILASVLGMARGDVETHNQHPDLLFVDYASPTTLAQKDDSTICFVTLGLIRECLYWATGEEHDIEERLCKAAGGQHCEFRITLGA
jgi:predicted hydrocarbon binding protein